jgi:uncharacterized protein (DUF1810 family)
VERSGDDPHDLARFTRAQDGVFAGVLAELRAGAKRSHWMWFVFPQVAGLGSSSASRTYAIRTLAEARAYLAHPVLGPRLRQCAEIVLAAEGRTAHEIFGSPDDLKLCSSMTLFAAVAGADSVFARVLAKYYGGRQDARTIELLRALEPRGDAGGR